MDPLCDPLTTRPIQTGWKFTMKLYPSGQFGFIDDPDRQFGNGLVWTRTRTPSDGPEPLLTIADGEVSAEADNAWWSDPTRKGGCRRLLPGLWQEVRQIQIMRSGSRSTTNGWRCCSTCTKNIWRANGVSWYCPRNTANAARDFSTRK